MILNGSVYKTIITAHINVIDFIFFYYVVILYYLAYVEYILHNLSYLQIISSIYFIGTYVHEASNGSDAVPTSHTEEKLVTLLFSTGKALCLLFCI